jgi:hydrogenase expression/formation protein HypC
MCLAVPARIVKIDGPNATVELDGVTRVANVAFIDSPAVGDYVLLHAGFAIRKWSAEDVEEFNRIMRETAETGSREGEGKP